MNRENGFVVLLSMMVVLALLAACGASEPTATTAPTSEPPVVPTDTPPAMAEAEEGITVTFERDQCVFHGPERVPAGGISIVLDVRDQTAHELYGVQALTMDEGHTAEELVLYQQEIRFPLWAHDQGFIEAAQGTSQERTIVLFEGPLFLTCFTNTADESQTEYAGMLGPVQVVNVVTKAEALAGIWHRTTPDSLGGDVYRQYTADGTYRMGRSPEELETQPLVEGEFWFEGNQVVMRDAAALPSYGSCLQPEQVGRYAVERLVNGHIRFVEVEDECRDRARMLGTGEMEPVVNSPKGKFAAKDGDWVLTFDDDGRFTFSESGVVAASGTFSIQGNELTWETDSYCGNAALMKATYTWTFENDTLLFQLKGKDNCADRLAVLDNIPYHVSLEPTAMPSAQNAATAVADAGDTAWDMVVLGDSLVADDYSVLPEAYAARIEEDLGVEVEIQNLAVGGETSQSLLTNVQKYPWYREPLQEAEVVLISVGGGDLPRMEKRFFGGDDCGGADNQDCLREQLEESQAEWDALLAEIVLLTKPGKTLIRPIIPEILEYYARVYKDQPEEVEAYNSYVVALYEHMARSCAERGIPVLDLYALYDGPNADPGIPEIAGTGDGVHVSDEGDAVIADLLQDLGYGFAKP